jgi:thiopurine S-methyltransferase
LSAGRDNHLWLQFWRDRRSDFHQNAVNPLLKRFWPGLELAAGSRVFVPLCGKSLDMLWLAQQGYNVIGVELSPIAVRAFFAENHLPVHRRRVGAFTLWQSGSISILCGDYFALSQSDLGVIDTVYDRASLTALPADIRALYSVHLSKILTTGSTIFLLTIEDAAIGDTLEQALGVDSEITTLYAEYIIDLAHVESISEPDPDLPGQSRRADYKVYRITKRAESNAV